MFSDGSDGRGKGFKTFLRLLQRTRAIADGAEQTRAGREARIMAGLRQFAA